MYLFYFIEKISPKKAHKNYLFLKTTQALNLKTTKINSLNFNFKTINNNKKHKIKHLFKATNLMFKSCFLN